MFREHIGYGALVAVCVVVGVYSYALLTDWVFLSLLFGVTIVGSFLPDVDSDSGMPFFLIFGTIAACATGVVLFYTLQETSDWRYIVSISTAALFFFWFVVGGIIKKMTHHRGIYHSIPAALIASLGIYLIAERFNFPHETPLILGAGMLVGYLTHLVLDELHAGITLDGIPFNPKSSLGGALKMFSDENWVNIATYTLLTVLFYAAFF